MIFASPPLLSVPSFVEGDPSLPLQAGERRTGHDHRTPTWAPPAPGMRRGGGTTQEGGSQKRGGGWITHYRL